jgi:hypothetical protein
MHTKNGIFLLLLLLSVVGAGILLLMSKHASDADLRRKRDTDAYAIRNALVFYMQQHNGALPSSLADLSFERSDVDPSPFILFDPETRKGQLGTGVIAEAEQAGRGKHRIVIYADGTVRWE